MKCSGPKTGGKNLVTEKEDLTTNAVKVGVILLSSVAFAAKKKCCQTFFLTRSFSQVYLQQIVQLETKTRPKVLTEQELDFSPLSVWVSSS